MMMMMMMMMMTMMMGDGYIPPVFIFWILGGLATHHQDVRHTLLILGRCLIMFAHVHKKAIF